MWPPPLARNKTGYLGLRNYSLDMLLLLHTKSLWNTIRIPKKEDRTQPRLDSDNMNSDSVRLVTESFTVLMGQNRQLLKW